MYYDRSLPEPFVRLLLEGQFFRRLIALVGSSWGADVLAHAELRRNAGLKRGSVKFYVGRSSLLEVIAKADGTFTLSAHPKYRVAAPDLFAHPMAPDECVDAVERYMQTAARIVGGQFTKGEGRVHAGLVRRHGHGHQASDPLVAVDTEVKVGFATKPDRDAFENELRRRFGKVHRELDTIGVLADGRICVVELKQDGESVEVAAAQAATHIFTFERLVAEQKNHDPAFDLGDTLNRLIEQKATVGLLPECTFMACPGASVVPVVAAPDRRMDWASQWRSELSAVRDRHSDLLDGLQLWRLSDAGEVEEIVEG